MNTVIASLMSAEKHLRLAHRASVLEVPMVDEEEREQRFKVALQSLLALQDMHHLPMEEDNER